MDVVEPAVRSRMMASIAAKNTRPEMLVRSYLHRAGLRFRMHVTGLPGRPDVVLPGHRVVVQVHGCFWHRHAGCRFSTQPATRADFWRDKFARNEARDKRTEQLLVEAGWTVLTFWECDAGNALKLDELYWNIRAVSIDVPSVASR